MVFAGYASSAHCRAAISRRARVTAQHRLAASPFGAVYACGLSQPFIQSDSQHIRQSSRQHGKTLIFFRSMAAFMGRRGKQALGRQRCRNYSQRVTEIYVHRGNPHSAGADS